MRERHRGVAAAEGMRQEGAKDTSACLGCCGLWQIASTQPTHAIRLREEPLDSQRPCRRPQACHPLRSAGVTNNKRMGGTQSNAGAVALLLLGYAHRGGFRATCCNQQPARGPYRAYAHLPFFILSFFPYFPSYFVVGLVQFNTHQSAGCCRKKVFICHFPSVYMDFFPHTPTPHPCEGGDAHT